MEIGTDMWIVLAAAVAVLALFAVNMWLTVCRGKGSRLLSRLMHCLALAALGYNIRRYIGDESASTIFVAHIIAIVCVLISFYRAERSPLTLPEE